MCGRFYFLTEDGFKQEIRPTDEISVETMDGWQRMKWGIPHFDGKGVHINARAETVREKPTFARHFEVRRCLVPCDGFFEWRRQEGKRTKDKYAVFREDGERSMMAGIYTEDGRVAVITHPPNAVVAPLHDRMPVILASREVQELWLKADANMAEMILRTHPDVPQRAEPETLTFDI